MFHEDLQGYLQRARREPRKNSVSFVDTRTWFLSQLPNASPNRRRQLFDRWQRDLAAFIEFTEGAAALPPEQVVREALSIELGLGGEASVLEFEAARVLNAFHARGSVANFGRYAVENLLISERAPLELTNAGRSFLRLTGRDAVRWLLLIETERSLGDQDPWRAPMKLVREALVGITPYWDNENDPEHEVPLFEYSEETLNRLVHLGVLRRENTRHGLFHSFSYEPALVDLLREVIAGDPWRELVRAQLGDHVDSTIGASPVRTAGVVGVTRVLTHEIRNALVPARHYLDQSIATGGVEVPRLQKAHNGIVRVLKFVDDLVSISEKVDSSRLHVRVDVLVGDSKALLDGGERVAVVGQSVLLALPREPLTRALRNVIQNALQATDGAVQVSWLANDLLTITVDDAGPGVPEHLREQIFADGYTTKSKQGGTGLGLAMTRQLINDLGGSVTCTSSPLGGARFVLALPLEEAK